MEPKTFARMLLLVVAVLVILSVAWQVIAPAACNDPPESLKHDWFVFLCDQYRPSTG